MLDTHYKRRMSGKSLKPKVKYKGNDVIMTTKKVMETVSLCHDIVIGEAEIFYLEYVFQLDSKIETMLFNLPWMGMLFMKGVLVADDVIYNNKIDCYMMSPKNPYIINPIEKLVPKYGKMKVLIEYTGHCPVDYRMGEKYTVNMVMWGNSIKE